MSLLRTVYRAIRGWRSLLLTRRLRGNPAALSAYRRLHVGCGPIRAPGCLNVDAQPFPSVDLVCRLTDLDRHYPANTAELIYACHVIEHFSHAEIPGLLAMFHRLLAPGGELRISVPDLDRMVRQYTAHWDHFQTPGHSPWIGFIYGGQLDAWDFHKTGFNFNWMKHLLTQAGFSLVEEYPHEPHFLGMTDASLVQLPFNEFLSLNVRAVK